MKISLTGLRPGTHEFHFEELPAKWGLENHPDLRAQVHLDVHLEKGANSIYVRNQIRTVGHFVCDRCLEEFDQAIEDSGRVVFSDETDLTASGGGEIHVYNPTAQEIDLTEEVRDLLLLSLPVKRLCREDCKGLCAGCGANLNFEKCRCTAPQEDARWQPLKKLLNH